MKTVKAAIVLVLTDFVVPYNSSPSEIAEVTEKPRRTAEIQTLCGPLRLLCVLCGQKKDSDHKKR